MDDRAVKPLTILQNSKIERIRKGVNYSLKFFEFLKVHPVKEGETFLRKVDQCDKYFDNRKNDE